MVIESLVILKIFNNQFSMLNFQVGSPGLHASTLDIADSALNIDH
jgi:hypothetical protein